jgi:hypothetical protein
LHAHNVLKNGEGHSTIAIYRHGRVQGSELENARPPIPYPIFYSTLHSIRFRVRSHEFPIRRPTGLKLSWNYNTSETSKYDTGKLTSLHRMTAFEAP